MLLKTDSALNVQWVRRHGITGVCCYEQLNSVRATPDGGYITNGSYFIKTDSAGFSGCQDSAVTYSTVNFPSDSSLTLAFAPVTVTDSALSYTLNDDSLSQTVICFSSVGISERFENDKVLVFPNPSGGIFRFEVTDSRLLENKSGLIVCSLLGERIRSFPLEERVSQIDLSSCPAGVYFWRVLSGGETAASGRLVRQ